MGKREVKVMGATWEGSKTTFAEDEGAAATCARLEEPEDEPEAGGLDQTAAAAPEAAGAWGRASGCAGG